MPEWLRSLFSSYHTKRNFGVDSEKQILDKMSEAESVFARNPGQSVMLIKKACLNIRGEGIIYTFKKELKHLIEAYLSASKILLSIIDAFQNNNRIFSKRPEFGVNQASPLGLPGIGTGSNFLREHTDRNDFIKCCEDCYSNDIKVTIERAEEFVNHKFTIFDQNLEFDGDIDWHKDPLTKQRWPKIHYKKIDYSSAVQKISPLGKLMRKLKGKDLDYVRGGF